MVTGLFSWPYAYPALAAVVGATLPNYQGMFLRGFGNQAHSQENGSTIGTTSTTHASGNLGVVQGDAIRNITGEIALGTARNETMLSADGATAVGALMLGASMAGVTGGASGNDSGYESFSFDASNVVPTTTENRPANVAVNYLIKAY